MKLGKRITSLEKTLGRSFMEPPALAVQFVGSDGYTVGGTLYPSCAAVEAAYPVAPGGPPNIFIQFANPALEKRLEVGP
jgi:hypothetical protein